MNVQALHEYFLGTLQANQSVRQEAELQLQKASHLVGFLGACLDILESDGVNPVVKKACSIYFKNKIERYWRLEANEEGCVDPDEKPIIRDRIVPVLAKLHDRSLRNQLVPVLSLLISYDYPKSWSNYLNITVSLFQDMTNMNNLYTGVLCFSELARSFRWQSNEKRTEALDPIIVQYFPSLLEIATQIVSSNDDSYEGGDILKMIIKTFKFVTYSDLPAPLQQKDNMLAWVTLHVQVMDMKLPNNVIELDEDDRTLSPWVKSQKWAYANVQRIFSRYGSRSLSGRFDYPEFRQLFVSTFIPELLSVFFKKIQSWRSGGVWLSKASLYHLISFLEQCTTVKPTWQLVKPHINYIISEVAFPALIQTDEHLEMFEDDPHEYIHMILDVYDETNSPEMAVISLLFTLSEKRTKTTIEPILQFSYGKLNSFTNQEESLQIAKEKESIFRIIGSISSKLISDQSPFKPQMEQFLSSFVLPEFKSKFAFLRARTCETLSKFDALPLTNEQNMNLLYHGILDCFNDVDNLPVQLEGALAIQAFIEVPQFKEVLGSIILPTMEKLLELSNKIDSDSVSAVIQECIETYSSQLQPFAVNLMCKLSEQLMRLLNEIYDASQIDADNYDEDSSNEINDKTTAALGIFNTLITILLYFENSTEIISQLELCYLPIVEFVLVQRIDDFYTETFELIENTTFLTRTVSAPLWKIFEVVMIQLIEDPDVLMMFDEMLPALKNYLIYGVDVIRSNKQYQLSIITFINKFFEIEANQEELDEDVSLKDIYYVCDLATNFVLSLNSEQLTEDISSNLIVLMTRLNERYTKELNKKKQIVQFKISIINVALSILVINPLLFFKGLNEAQSLELFLSMWLDIVPCLKKVFELKLSILGYLAVVNISLETLKEMNLIDLLKHVGSKFAILFGELPRAIKTLEMQREDFDPSQMNEADQLLLNQQATQGGNTYDDDDDDDDDENENAASHDFIQFVNQETRLGGLVNEDEFEDIMFGKGGFDSFEDDYDDNAFANTSLDNINVFKGFKETFDNLQANDTDKYGLVVSGLTPEEQEVLVHIMTVASATGDA